MKLNPAWLVALGCTVLAGVAFLPVLGRYPIPFCDEGFWGWPAANYLLHGSFTYDQGPQAPHGDTVWAYHAPLYPRAQIPMLALFGISTFGLRVLAFVAANVGHLLLSWTMLRRRHGGVAAVCAILWLGDRSLLHTLHGRMDGLALFWGLCGFCALFVAVDTPGRARSGWSVPAGLAFGLAVVTHMISALWTVAAAIVILTEVGRHERWAAGVRVLAGWLVGVGIGLLPLAGHPRAAFEQFMWDLTTQFGQGMTVVQKWAYLFQTLTWARAWIIALIAAVVGLGGVLTRELLRSRPPAAGGSEHRLVRLATLFAVCSLPALLQRGVYEYYIVYFTSWATLALSATLVTWMKDHRRAGVVYGLAGVMVAAWVPSAVWNAYRVREAYALWSAMDPAPFQQELRRRCSTGGTPAPLQGTAWLFPWAIQAGVDFRPLSYLEDTVPPQPGVRLLVTPDHWNALRASGAVSEWNYQLEWRTDVYRGRYSIPYEVRMYAPKGSAALSRPTPSHP